MVGGKIQHGDNTQKVERNQVRIHKQKYTKVIHLL